MPENILAEKIIYWLIFVIFVLGIFGIMDRKNLIKKLMSMNIMQVAVIMFFLTLGQKTGATLPIEKPGLDAVSGYINPLPHALMLTAIVVSLSTTGVALAFLLRIRKNYDMIEEDVILRRMNNE